MSIDKLYRHIDDQHELDDTSDDSIPQDEGPMPWSEIMGDPVAQLARRLHNAS